MCEFRHEPGEGKSRQLEQVTAAPGFQERWEQRRRKDVFS